jgi:hypothetical protein
MEAGELFLQVIESRKKVLGQEHLDTLTSMGNLAATYLKQERWKEAEKLFVPVMETRKKIVGQKHPSTSIWSLPERGCSISRSSYRQPSLR